MNINDMPVVDVILDCILRTAFYRYARHLISISRMRW